MAMLKLYKSSLLSCKYHTKSGKELAFVAGRFATDDEVEIAELDAEVKARHPHIYIDSAEAEVDSVKVDPVEAIRKKAIADYLAEQEAKVGADMGATDNSAVGAGAGMTTSASAAIANLKATSDSK